MKSKEEMKKYRKELREKILTKKEIDAIRKEQNRQIRQIEKNFTVRVKIYISDLVRNAAYAGEGKVYLSGGDICVEVYKKMLEEDPNSKFLGGINMSDVDRWYESAVTDFAIDMDFDKSEKQKYNHDDETCTVIDIITFYKESDISSESSTTSSSSSSESSSSSDLE